MRLLVIFHRLGPYHYARLRAANSVRPAVALELSGEDKTYAWAHVVGNAEFERHVIFPAADSESIPGRRIHDEVCRKLDAIRPDVVVIPGFYDKGAISSLIWCHEHGIPGIVVSDTTERDFPRHFWREWVKQQVTAYFSAGLVGGQAQAEYLVKLGMLEDRVFVGYDVVDNDYFSAKADEVRQNAQHCRDQHSLPERYFLTSNRFIARKNLFRLTTAYAEYRQQTADPWDLVMLGDGELMPLLKGHMDALHLRDHVILPGFKQYEELPVYYALAGGYIQASTAEPWGLTVNEAMVCGLPVLVSNACGCAKEHVVLAFPRGTTVYLDVRSLATVPGEGHMGNVGLAIHRHKEEDMKNLRKWAIGLIAVLFLGSALSAQEKAAASWSFETVREGKSRDMSGGIDDAITGHFRLVPGAKGQAIVMDGYTTCIVRGAAQVPKLGTDFSLETWIALGAYPWNWVPIAAQENTVSLNSNLDAVTWPEDITVNSPRNGFYFGISPQGHLGLHVGAGGWVICQSESPIPLRKWTHVAAVFRGGEGISLYINGRKAGEAAVKANFRQATQEDLRIGMSRQKIEPSHPVRAFATLPCWYSLDGLLDELRIHGTALSGEEIATRATTSRPGAEPDLSPRVMPSGPKGLGVFGASYMKLAYYPEWDNLWPVSSDPDIVVQFDDSPVRVVFWRGTRYSPAWVMEGDLWMADQSCENFNDTDGCIEHMLDPRCRFSQVRIIENSEARVVVHWRYCPTSANGNYSQVDPVTGWEDWVDEYYTFYPDQVGIRNVILHTKGGPLHPDEVIVLCQPGQRPEDVIDLAAMTLVNLKGQSRTYTWTEKAPVISKGDKYLHFGSESEERPVIIRTNLKSETKPFQVFETTNNIRIFAHEHRPGVSHFPWWNHWPVAQIPSDGRYCQAPDRASSFSLAWGGPPAHKEEGLYWWAWMYGASKQPAESLVPIARAWLHAPLLKGEGVDGRFDPKQRCYMITKGPRPLKFRLEGSAESPIFNPAFVVENWGPRDASLRLNGREIPRGKDFRIGHIRRINSYDLVVWIKMEAGRQVDVELLPKS